MCVTSAMICDPGWDGRIVEKNMLTLRENVTYCEKVNKQ